MSRGTTAVGATAIVAGLAAIAASFISSRFKVISETAQKALLGVGSGATVLGIALTASQKSSSTSQANAVKEKQIPKNPRDGNVAQQVVYEVMHDGTPYTFAQDPNTGTIAEIKKLEKEALYGQPEVKLSDEAKTAHAWAVAQLANESKE